MSRKLATGFPLSTQSNVRRAAMNASNPTAHGALRNAQRRRRLLLAAEKGHQPNKGIAHKLTAFKGVPLKLKKGIPFCKRKGSPLN